MDLAWDQIRRMRLDRAVDGESPTPACRPPAGRRRWWRTDHHRARRGLCAGRKTGRPRREHPPPACFCRRGARQHALASSAAGMAADELELRHALQPRPARSPLVDTGRDPGRHRWRNPRSGAVPATAALQARPGSNASAEPWSMPSGSMRLRKADLGIGVSLTDRHGTVLWDSEHPRRRRPRQLTLSADVARTLAWRLWCPRHPLRGLRRSGYRGPACRRPHPASGATLIGVLSVSRAGGRNRRPSCMARMSRPSSICALAAILGGLTGGPGHHLGSAAPLSTADGPGVAVRPHGRPSHTPAPSGGPSEILALCARAFSSLADELEGRRLCRGQWAQCNWSHEMKAPIAGLRAAAGAAGWRAWRRADRDLLLANLQEGS